MTLNTPASSEFAKIRLVPSSWAYMNEGVENVLLMYVGSESNLQGWVLRLTKCDVGADLNSDSQEAIIFAQMETRRKQGALLFANEVVSSLVGAEYVLPQRLVQVDAAFLVQVRENVESQRPKNRLVKHIDQRQAVGMLTREMISRATSSTKPGTHAVTVELKPKCMILPRSEFTSPESSVKHKVCWYCMHQYTLRKDGKVSKFCPLELFSRDFGRISRSLDAFAQSPHNNLVVFVDGRSVVDEQGKISERCVPHWKMLRDAVAAIVQKEALFPMLQRAQRNLDLFNIESILPIYKRALGTGVLTTEEPPVTTWLDAHAACKQRQGRECSICTRIGDKQAIMEYMLSTTLKDASILIKFAGWPARGQASSSSMANPAYTIGIVDHDPKKVGNIPKYFKNDQDIVATYLAHNPNPVDQRPCHE